MERLFYTANLTPGCGQSAEGFPANERHVTAESDANLVSSATGVGDFHMPVLDIDRIPVRLVPSSTPGNYHLYIDYPIRWEDYAELLDLLARIGILEPGYVNASKARQMTFVRKPGVAK